MKKDNEEELEEVSDGEDYNETKLKAGALISGVVLFVSLIILVWLKILWI